MRFCDWAGVTLVSVFAGFIVDQIRSIPFQIGIQAVQLSLLLFIRYLTREAVKLGEGCIRFVSDATQASGVGG